MPPPIPTPVKLPARASYRGFYILGAVLLGMVCAIVGITGYFRLGSETETLRDSLMSSMQGQWHKRIAVRVGFCTTALVRAVSQGFKLPPEARAGLQAVRGAEFGLYELEDGVGPGRAGAVLARADQAMLRRGWERVVGVVKEHEMVAIYMPRYSFSARNVKCALVVLQGKQLIVAGARGNLKPLAEIVAQHLQSSCPSLLAKR